MPKKKEKNVFQQIEAIYGPIPTCLKEILKNTGFDNSLSIELLDEDAIKDIELYMLENGGDIINALQCCNSSMYKNQIAKKQFELAPGHKYTILGIAKKVREINRNGNVTSVDSLSNGPILNENTHQASDTVAANMNEEKELKLQLLKKLEEALSNHPNVGQVELYKCIDESNVIEFEIRMMWNKANGTSKYVCPYCRSSIQATCVNAKWKAHNVIRHLRNHFRANGASSTVAKTTNDRTRCPSPIDITAIAVEEVEQAVQNKKTGGMTDFDVLKEFDPLFEQ